MENQDNAHWDKLFTLCKWVIFGVILYCFLITFVPIPKDNIENARAVLIFFIGTLVGYCFNMLSPGIATKKPDTQVTQTGDSPVANVPGIGTDPNGSGNKPY